jgi:hypothetical protein
VKYVDIKTIRAGTNAFGIALSGPAAYQVWAMRDGVGSAIVRSDQKLDLDKRAIGLRVRKSYRAPSGEPALFTREEAVHVAHQVGRYYLGLGDIVFSYTTVDGLQNPNFFEVD